MRAVGVASGSQHGDDSLVLRRWRQTKRDEIRHEMHEEEVSAEDGAGCLVDGCCLGGCLFDLIVIAFLAGGAMAVGVSAMRVLTV